MKDKEMDPVYARILITLDQYSDPDGISINRARYAIANIHKFGRPFNTQIISKLSRMGAIKLKGRRGNIEILKNVKGVDSAKIDQYNNNIRLLTNQIKILEEEIFKEINKIHDINMKGGDQSGRDIN